MEITSIRLRRASGGERVRAAASICIDGEFVVHGLRVIEGPSGLFVSMPAQRTRAGEYRDMAHPVTAEARERIQAAVLAAYERWAGNGGQARAAREEPAAVAGA